MDVARARRAETRRSFGSLGSKPSVARTRQGRSTHLLRHGHRNVGRDGVMLQEAPNRFAITVSVMAATAMNALDGTIANVALPHIQGSVSASASQITWVLTSY